VEERRYAVVYLSKIQGISSTNAQAVYIYLSKHADKDNVCYVTMEYIASCICMSRETVKRAMSELHKIGAIRIIKETKRSNKYELIIDEN